MARKRAEAGPHYKKWTHKLKNDLHEKLKQAIKASPLIIGLTKVENVCEEVACLYEDGNICCQPDLIFRLSNGAKVLVEVKSTDHPSALETLEEQLKRGYQYFKTYYNEDYFCIGVYQNRDGKIKYYTLFGRTL